MRVSLALVTLVVLISGCDSKSGDSGMPKAPAGRLVSEVVASFEDGPGQWVARDSAGSLLPAHVMDGDASRGNRWFHVEAASGITVEAPVPTPDWTKFGDMIRADVRLSPPPTNVAGVVLTLTNSKEQTASSPELPVKGGAWQTVEWKAGNALSDIAHLRVAVRPPEGWKGSIGLDNIRVGSATGLSKAWTVVMGPFPTREAAVQQMTALKVEGIESFPLHEQAWYLSLGTFATKSGARKAAEDFQAREMKVSVIER